MQATNNGRMPRPSGQLDEALLASGRALFPHTGCSGLSLRTLSEHAGVNPGMFHYHFKSKDNFLRVLLQRWYEELFSGLQRPAAGPGPALERLRAALHALAGFARTHRALVARLWLDAMAGEAVVVQFLRENAPRHLALVAGLLEAAQREGSIAELPSVQRMAFIGGSVLLPVVLGGSLLEQVGAPRALQRAFADQVASEAAIAQRVDLALAALARAPDAASRKARRGTAPLKGPAA
jgi:AcrR family transcriptional regulator